MKGFDHCAVKPAQHSNAILRQCILGYFSRPRGCDENLVCAAQLFNDPVVSEIETQAGVYQSADHEGPADPF